MKLWRSKPFLLHGFLVLWIEGRVGLSCPLLPERRERVFILDNMKLEMMKQNRMGCRETIKSRVSGRYIQGIKQHLFDIQAELV